MPTPHKGEVAGDSEGLRCRSPTDNLVLLFILEEAAVLFVGITDKVVLKKKSRRH